VVDQLLERIGRQLAQACDGLDVSALEPLQREREARVVHGSIEVQRAEERRKPGGLRGLDDLFEHPLRHGWECACARLPLARAHQVATCNVHDATDKPDDLICNTQ
jgi:hypothetical protein